MPLRLDRHLNSGIVMITGFLDSLYFLHSRMFMAGILPFGAVFIELFFILTVSYEWFYFLRSTILFSFLKTSSSDATVLLMIKANVSGYTRCGVDSHLSRTVCNFKKARATCIFRRFQIFTQRRLSNVMEVRKTTLEM